MLPEGMFRLDSYIRETYYQCPYSLGGVHRGAQDSEFCSIYNKPSILMTCKSAMDISADLHELTRCSVGVVSAGVKSILDIGRYVMVPLI